MKPCKGLPRIVIAAPFSGAGKTTISIGVMAALRKRGLKVQPFKIGPDYIDPGFHREVTKNNSINLDGWLLKEHTILDMFSRYAKDADISVIEGVMGLYDGIGIDPMEGSSAGIAETLKAPVILVLPAQGMSTTIAATILGLKNFRNVNIAGVILNQVSTNKYYELLKEAIETHTEVKVVGRLPVVKDIEFKSRHLGLVQNCEVENRTEIINRLVGLIEKYIDLDEIISIANDVEKLNIAETNEKIINEKVINIAVAYDEAFQFYYYENIKTLENLGANIIYFSPLYDTKLPGDISGIYIGGGYPELYAKKLEENVSIRKEIKDMADLGIPIYGECGGYMYICNTIKNLDNKKFDMVGVFDCDIVMTNRLQNFGYAELTAQEESCIFKIGDEIRSHEFHTSYVKQEDENIVLTEKYKNNEKISWYSGKKKKNAFGMFPHIHFLTNINIARNFIESCLKYKELGD